VHIKTENCGIGSENQMRYKAKINAAIIVVAALIIITSCLFFYDKYTSDTVSDSLEYSSITDSDASKSISADISMDISSIDEVISDIENSEQTSAIEVVLHYSEQLDLQLDASYAIAAYTDGSIIYSKNALTRCYPASLTKLLTVSTAIRYIKNDYIFKVGDELDYILEGSSVAGLEKGDKIDFLTLVDALLVPSGNDAAYVMAVGIGRLYSENPNMPVNEALSVFLTLMNQTADDLGCTDSNFANPDGYHNASHHTTAADILKIAIHTNSLDIVKNSINKSKARGVYSNKDVTWINTNLLLKQEDSHYYQYATGMKTGATPEAGKCLAAIAYKNGKEVITIILDASSDEARYKDALTVFNATL